MQSGMQALGQTAGELRYQSSVAAAEVGQFQVLLQNLNELDNLLQDAAKHLESKTNALLGMPPPQPASPPGNPGEPNGVVQSMICVVRNMIRTTQTIQDHVARIDQAGIGS